MVNKKSFFKLGRALGILAVLLGCFYVYKSHGFRFYFPIEGPYLDINFRDLGASVNECSGGSSLKVKENRIFRSSGFFSGQACSKVGNPVQIISLNYGEHNSSEYYCVQDNGDLLIGQHYSVGDDLDNIETLKSWNNPAFTRAFCLAYYDALTNIIEQRRLLIHCDAGRDRTGAFSILLLSTLREAIFQSKYAAEFGPALECDYDKSATLIAKKHPRMRLKIKEWDQKGGPLSLVTKACHLEPDFIANAAKELLVEPSINR